MNLYFTRWHCNAAFGTHVTDRRCFLVTSQNEKTTLLGKTKQE